MFVSGRVSCTSSIGAESKFASRRRRKSSDNVCNPWMRRHVWKSGKRFAKHDLWQRKRTSNEKISVFDLFVCLFVGWLVLFLCKCDFCCWNSITPWFGSSTVRQLQGSLSTNVTRILTTGVSWIMFLMEEDFSSPRGKGQVNQGSSLMSELDDPRSLSHQNLFYLIQLDFPFMDVESPPHFLPAISGEQPATFRRRCEAPEWSFGNIFASWFLER